VFAEDLDSLFSLTLEELSSVKVTTASKRSQEANAAPSIISVFTKSDINKMGVSSLIDVLKHVPGIETSMGPSGQWRVSIRGQRKDGIILLLVDGHPFNDFYDGQAPFDLPLSLISKVEIIRGPGSALYGTNAVAGVINVFTNKDEAFALGLGSNNSVNSSMVYQKNMSDGVLNFNVGLNSSDGANVVEGEDILDMTNVNLGFPTHTNRFVDELYLSVNYNDKNFDFSFLGLDKEQGPWVGPSVVFGSETIVNKAQYFLNGTYKHDLSNSLKIKSNVYFDAVDFNAFYEDIVPGRVLLSNKFVDGGFTKEQYKTLNIGGEISLEYSQSDSVFHLAGISYNSLDMNDYSLSRNYEVIGFIPHNSFANHDQLIFEQKEADRRIAAIFAQSEIQWDHLSLTLGFRYDDYSDFGDTFNPRVGLVYKLTPSWRTKLLFGSAFRAPTFKELYDNTRIGSQGFTGNKELQPEKNETWEWGIEYQQNDYVIKANVFDIKSENVIELFDPDGSGARGSVENIGNINTRGFEFEVIYQLNSSIRLFANYSNYKALFEWSNEALFEESRLYLADIGDEQLFNQPRTRANIGLDWSQEKWTVFLSANYGGIASHNNTLPLEGLRNLITKEYLQYNFSANFDYSRSLSFKLSVNNLGDDKNSDPNGSSESDVLGVNGLLQPTDTLMLSLQYTY
jgi:iron complex outermembrane receptor protein